jgi:carbamate kinase
VSGLPAPAGDARPTIVVALGGNALLRRSEPMTAGVQRRNVRVAARAIAPLTAAYRVVVSHGNGPQVGLLALQAESYADVEPYPLDVLGAETQGMIGYLVEQELRNVLPADARLATLLTMIEVDADDEAFGNPTKFVGPVYGREEAERRAAGARWHLRQDGAGWRRVVPSPAPRRIVEIEAIRRLLEGESVVICAGGGGIPTARAGGTAGDLEGVEAVIDKDLASVLLAEAVDAHLLIMATDVDGVYRDWGTPSRRRLGWVTPAELREHGFPSGSMGPKVDAAARFASVPGRRAAIGSLEQIDDIVAGTAGTNVTVDPAVVASGGAGAAR